jgi:GTPase
LTLIHKRAYLIGVHDRKTPVHEAEAELNELHELTAALGLTVVGQTLQRVTQFNSKFYMGLGLAESLKAKLASLDAGLLIVDGELSPGQERNLEKATGAKVYTRTDVILEIFAQRAQTREGKLQVELAQLQYVLPRMVGMWTHFGRSMGGSGAGMGGVGETQLEIDRRRTRQRITHLRRELKEVQRSRREHRKQRSRREIPTFALVGYTNAGKSSLLNRLTEAGAIEADQVFATLDPLTERLVLPSKQLVLVSDTVGFIRRLPHTLVEAFRATLEEVTDADVLLHVVDGADEEAETKIATVREVLEQIGAGRTPTILVINKSDAMGQQLIPAWFADGELEVVGVSAHTGEGIDSLLTAMERAMSARMDRVQMHIPYSAGKVLADVLAHGEIYARRDLDDGVELDVQLTKILAGRYREYVASPNEPFFH